MSSIPWMIKDQLKEAFHLQTQEEQICYLLNIFQKLFSGERLSFYRYSSIGHVGEGIAMLEGDSFQSINHVRDDIRGLSVIRQAIEMQRPFAYYGQDLITHITSRYLRNDPLKTLLIVPIIANNIPIAYICSEFIKKEWIITEKCIYKLSTFGKIAGEMLVQPRNAEVPKLSHRENQIIQLLANGLSTKEIANSLSLSEATIKQYIKSTMTKLEAKNRTHAVSIYLKQSIIERVE